MKGDVEVVGVGMTQFRKPSEGFTFRALGTEAIGLVLDDAGITYNDLDQAYVGYVYGDSCSGQHVVYEAGLSGIPIVNVNNNCSTGSTALFMARQAVLSGKANCVLALGFEEMTTAGRGHVFGDLDDPLEKYSQIAEKQLGNHDAPWTVQLYAGAAREYISRYGAKEETFAKVAEKNRRHAANNPNAVYRDALSVEEILSSRTIFEPLTKYQCCPPTSGAAAAIVCSKSFAARKGLTNGISIAGQSLVTDLASTFDSNSMICGLGTRLAETASRNVFEESGLGPEDIDVIELHDSFTPNELLSYEALGLAAEGAAEKLLEDGDTTYGGKYVVNPSGGLLSKGHPMGATGLAQCAELVWQLRGDAGARQVQGAVVGLQHNIGLGSACVVTLYKKS